MGQGLISPRLPKLLDDPEEARLRVLGVDLEGWHSFAVDSFEEDDIQRG